MSGLGLGDLEGLGRPVVVEDLGQDRLAGPVEVLAVVLHELVRLAVAVEHAVELGHDVAGEHVPAATVHRRFAEVVHEPDHGAEPAGGLVHVPDALSDVVGVADDVG